MTFINPDFENVLKIHVIKNYLPKLNMEHREILYKYLYGVIQMLASAHDFYSKQEEFIVKLKQNNYNNLKWLLTLIIPYIGNGAKHIKSLEDLYTSTTCYSNETLKKAHKFNIEPINFEAPKYKFSNLQYGVCNRGEIITSVHFEEAHLSDNYYLLLITIYKSRHKLHINWIDIIPYTLNTYKYTKLYIDTKQKLETGYDVFDPVIRYPINNVNNVAHINGLNTILKGLNIEDIYNVISNDLYNSIINYKWLLFIAIVQGNRMTYINLLQTFFTNKIFKYEIYEEFEDEWNTLKHAYKARIEHKGIPSKIVLKFVNTLVLFYNNTLKISLIGIPKTPIIDRNDETTVNENQKNILNKIDGITANDILNYIKKSLKYINITWYSHYLLNDDKTELKTDHEYQINVHSIHIFCMQFVHIITLRNGNVTYERRLPYTWDELNNDDRQIILNRLTNNNNNWFNMSIYKRRRPSFNTWFEIRSHLCTIIFETLICKGALSYIIPANVLTDNTQYNMTNDVHKKKLIKVIENTYFNKHSYKNYAYYYLTCTPYGKIKEFNLLINEKVESFDYFKICSTPKYMWYIAYPFHWISQIGFCHRFINTRVSYVTGATGTGKTAHMPKIYMYYLKMIDNIFDPTVIVTVPRIPIIKKQVDFMSESLALPSTIYSENLKKNMSSEYTVVQGEYKGSDRNISTKNIDLKIKFVTDGTIVRELRKNNLLKQRITRGIYPRNTMDVIIVDEAHEHNINMDMILTLMRNIIFYNNSVRLVIMSATIDDDEPYYRRYYRDINDNRKYPLNMYIAKYKIDRMNIDRRWHFSGISESTTYNITEIYKPGASVIDIVTEIIKDNNYNGILIFHSGRSDIYKTVTNLNSKNILPDHMIALPYYAKLNDSARAIFDNIDITIKQITINKTEVTNDIYLNEQLLLKTGKGSYTKYVLVATNIAEASLTINSLTHVIDTGVEKQNTYNIYSKIEILTQHYINESSITQRKGRVGRVAPGTYYYTYNKNLIADTKPYKISSQDIKDILYEYLCVKDDIPLFINLVNCIVNAYNINTTLIKEYTQYKNIYYNMDDPAKEDTNMNINKMARIDSDQIDIIKLSNNRNNRDMYYRLILFNIVTNIISKSKRNKINDLIYIIINQYFVSDTLYSYYGNSKYYDYKNMKVPCIMYLSGFSNYSLSDKQGTFYIIHPDENIIGRNINGDIICVHDKNLVTLETNKCNKYTYFMCSKKICLYWEMLLNNAFITVNIGHTPTIYKSHLCINILKIINKLEEKHKEVVIAKYIYMIMIYGYGLSCSDTEFNSILILCALLHEMNEMTYPINIYIPDTQKPTFNETLNIIKNKNKHIKNIFRNKLKYVTSDIHVLHHIITLLLKEINYNHTPFKSTNVQSNAPPNYTANEKILYDKNNENIERKRSQDNDANKLRNAINNNKNIIDHLGINVKFIENIIKSYTIFVKKNNIIKKMKKEEKEEGILTDIKKMFKSLRNYIDVLNIDIIKAVIMLTYPYNIKHKIYGSQNSYISIYSPRPEYIYTLDINKTFVDTNLYQNYILNIYSNNKMIYLILNITLNDIKLLGNIYNRHELHRKYYIDNISYEQHRFYINKYIYDVYKNNTITDNNIYEYTLALGNLNKTIQHVHNDLLQIDNTDIFAILSKFHDQPQKITTYYTLLNGL